MLRDVQMSTRLAARIDSLELTAEIVNGRHEPIFIIDTVIVVGRDGPVIQRDNLVVSFEGHDVALLASKLVALDPTMRWATPPTVYATRVEPGSRYVGVFRTALPLEAAPRGSRGSRGAPVPAGEPASDRCNDVRFEVGVIPWVDGLVGGSVVIDGKPLAQLIARAASHQVVLTAMHSGVALPCIR